MGGMRFRPPTTRQTAPSTASRSRAIDKEQEEDLDAPHPEPRTRPSVPPAVIWRPQPAPTSASPRPTQKTRASERPAEWPTERPGDWRVLITRSRGVQVGNHNRQLNLYEYRVQRPQIDLQAVLRDSAVQRALLRLADAPNDDRLRRSAEESLTGTFPEVARLFRRPASLDLRHVTNSRHELTTGWDWLDGLVVVTRCEGVQVGDHQTQRNTYRYVATHTKVNARHLLADHPEVARAVIGVAIDGGSSAALQHTLTRVVESLPRLHAPDASGVTAHPSIGPPRVIAGRDGVSVGEKLAQRNRTAVHADLGPPTVRPLVQPQAPRREDPPPATRAASTGTEAPLEVESAMRPTPKRPSGESDAEAYPTR